MILRLDRLHWQKSIDISVDYAVMEKADNLVASLETGWSDLGDWNSVWKAMGQIVTESLQARMRLR